MYTRRCVTVCSFLCILGCAASVSQTREEAIMNNQLKDERFINAVQKILIIGRKKSEVDADLKTSGYLDSKYDEEEVDWSSYRCLVPYDLLVSAVYSVAVEYENQCVVDYKISKLGLLGL